MYHECGPGHITDWAKNSFWDAWMLNTHYSVRSNDYSKKMVCLAHNRRDTHTHTQANAGPLYYLICFLDKYYKFSFLVSTNVCISFVHTWAYVCVRLCIGGLGCLLYNYQCIVTHLSQTHTHIVIVCSIATIWCFVRVLSVLRFVSIRILCSLRNVYIEIMCYLHFPSVDGKFFSHSKSNNNNYSINKIAHIFWISLYTLHGCTYAMHI